MKLLEQVRLLDDYRSAKVRSAYDAEHADLPAALPRPGLDTNIPTLDRRFRELAEAIGSTTFAADRADLLNDLQQALKLEHATIPPYLTALYTLAPKSSWQALEVLRSVVVEEMLHLTLVANVINALGGTPRTDEASFMPDYPSPLPLDIDGIVVSLFGFSREAVEQGCAIERPAAIRPEVLFAARPASGAMTIGEFYLRIEAKLRALVDRYGEALVFSGRPSRQVTADYYYDGAGAAFAVTDIVSALLALQTIREQGEGVSDTIWTGNREQFKGFPEVAHYFRFSELLAGREYQWNDTVETGPRGAHFEVDWGAAIPVKPNSKLADYLHAPEIYATAEAFNVAYWDFLRIIQRAFNGESALLQQGIGNMFRLKDLFQRLVNTPLPDDPQGRHAAPTFEYAPPSSSATR
ncbi:ferritin-like domain-containing protein [Burkholderia ubonensis]|uniref:ferritin-like domain-containing protein n=1 Tax=Burkholderia ubonensis TaxID=101571 RepID=UPI0009B5755A|nr:ferritin-like protein [Burkholderia ubonensis]